MCGYVEVEVGASISLGDRAFICVHVHVCAGFKKLHLNITEV